ncbi:hypothetical protein pf16_162 [Pseudomonas phage pf16]|uniref:Uncharacterized protein n=1 Tax=Pseudomonas phage pf16 TaxID=1815630 RepID=A0A1S5R427_9CAUD|nr:hypothetical protein FDG98_gp136 [Pseudomonas phage pf16]AND75085.1 hypothetical protein pf16_162 [Pseudomonas phage pf16]
MKLIEIVKSEYATFPNLNYCYLSQDADGEIHMWVTPPTFMGTNWNGSSEDSWLIGDFPLADDYKTAILTHDDFAVKVEPAGDRLYEIRGEVKRLEGEITERIEKIRELKAELAQHGFTMPFRRGKRRTRR